MPECLACEKQYNEEESTAAAHPQTYCSFDCELVFQAAMEESAEESKVRGLVDAEGNSILGGAYQQAVQRTINTAMQSIGIKFPPKEQLLQ